MPALAVVGDSCLLALLHTISTNGNSAFCFYICGSMTGFFVWTLEELRASREDGIAERKVRTAACGMETFVSGVVRCCYNTCQE